VPADLVLFSDSERYGKTKRRARPDPGAPGSAWITGEQPALWQFNPSFGMSGPPIGRAPAHHRVLSDRFGFDPRGNVPPFLLAKSAITPEKNGNRLDFVHCGALYLLNTPCFQASFAAKERSNDVSFITSLDGSDEPQSTGKPSARPGTADPEPRPARAW
jgi:hypothetical protein